MMQGYIGRFVGIRIINPTAPPAMPWLLPDGQPPGTVRICGYAGMRNSVKISELANQADAVIDRLRFDELAFARQPMPVRRQGGNDGGTLKHATAMASKPWTVVAPSWGALTAIDPTAAAR